MMIDPLCATATVDNVSPGIAGIVQSGATACTAGMNMQNRTRIQRSRVGESVDIPINEPMVSIG